VKVGYHVEKQFGTAEKDCLPDMSSHLTSQEALRLTATFAFTADRMRATDAEFAVRTKICETASRVAFLRAHRISQREEILPRLGETFRRAIFAIA